MNQQITKWFKNGNKPLFIYGCHGSGKSYTITEYCRRYKIHYNIIYPDTIKTIKPVNHILSQISNTKTIAILDECEIIDKISELDNCIIKLQEVYKKVVCLSELKFANIYKEHICEIAEMLPMQKIPYSSYSKLVSGIFKNKKYYQTIFDGNIGQLILQSRIDINSFIDKSMTNSQTLDKIRKGEPVSISDTIVLSNIIIESYIYCKDRLNVSNRLMYSIYNYKSFNINIYLKLYYPLYNQNMFEWTYIENKLQWTRISNIKYRKKMIQNISRAINIKFITHSSYEKIMIFRCQILTYIKQKDFAKAYQLFQEIGLNHKFINYLPKVQCNDEFFTYSSRLKPFYSFINKQ